METSGLNQEFVRARDSGEHFLSPKPMETAKQIVEVKKKHELGEVCKAVGLSISLVSFFLVLILVGYGLAHTTAAMSSKWMYVAGLVISLTSVVSQCLLFAGVYEVSYKQIRKSGGDCGNALYTCLSDMCRSVQEYLCPVKNPLVTFKRPVATKQVRVPERTAAAAAQGAITQNTPTWPDNAADESPYIRDRTYSGTNHSTINVTLTTCILFFYDAHCC